MFERHLGTRFEPSLFHSISNDAFLREILISLVPVAKSSKNFFDCFSKGLGNRFTTEPLDDHLAALIARDELGFVNSPVSGTVGTFSDDLPVGALEIWGFYANGNG